MIVWLDDRLELCLESSECAGEEIVVGIINFDKVLRKSSDLIANRHGECLSDVTLVGYDYKNSIMEIVNFWPKTPLLRFGMN